MRWLVRIASFLALAAVALGAGLYAIVQPPAPLALPEQGVVLDGVTLIRPGEGREAQRTVVVRGGTIESIEAAPPDASGPFAGMYVMPGLTDLHVHFPPASLPGQGELFAFLLLYHGVTAVRDAGDVDGTATEPVRRGIAEGRFPGPRIVRLRDVRGRRAAALEEHAAGAQRRRGAAGRRDARRARLRLREGVQRARRADAGRGSRGRARARAARDRPRAAARPARGRAPRRRAAPHRRPARERPRAARFPSGCATSRRSTRRASSA